MPQNLAEPRLATPGSGLYAEILGSRGSWRSPSALGSGLNLAAEPLPGERRLEHARTRGRHPHSRALARHPLGAAEGESRDFVIRAAQSLEPWHQQMLRVRTGLVTGSSLLGAAPARRPRGCAPGFAQAAAAARKRDRRHRGRPPRIAGDGMAARTRGRHGQPECTPDRRAQAARALPHDARQPGAQPEDTARGHARPDRGGSRPKRRRSRRSSTGCRPSSSTS